MRKYGRATAAMTSVVTSLLARREELAQELAEHLRTNVAQYRADPVLAGDVLTDAAPYLTAVLGRFTTDHPFDTTYARRAGRDRARAAIPLSTVMEVYRVGIAHPPVLGA